MGRQVHRHRPHGKPQTTIAPGRMDGDVVHPSLERVLISRLINHELRDVLIVAEQEIETFLLAGEQGGVEIAKIVSSLLRVLDRVHHETVLEPNRILGVALTPFEGVLSRLRENPEVGNAGAWMLRTLCADPTMIQGHLQSRSP